MFPSFELTNWYAARNLLEIIKGSIVISIRFDSYSLEFNEDNEISHDHVLSGAKSLLPVLRQWMKRDRVNN
jgi:hypothetical protein